MADKIVVDVSNQTYTRVPLTSEEVAEGQLREQEWINYLEQLSELEQKVIQAETLFQDYIDNPSPSAQETVQVIKTLCKFALYIRRRVM